jgi:hypothetical protein
VKDYFKTEAKFLLLWLRQFRQRSWLIPAGHELFGATIRIPWRSLLQAIAPSFGVPRPLNYRKLSPSAANITLIDRLPDLTDIL